MNIIVSSNHGSGARVDVTKNSVEGEYIIGCVTRFSLPMHLRAEGVPNARVGPVDTWGVNMYQAIYDLFLDTTARKVILESPEGEIVGLVVRAAFVEG